MMQNTPLKNRGCGRKAGTRIVARSLRVPGESAKGLWRQAEKLWDSLPNAMKMNYLRQYNTAIPLVAAFLVAVFSFAFTADAAPNMWEPRPQHTPPGCHGQDPFGQGPARGGAWVRTPRGFTIYAPPSTPIYYRRRPLLGPQIRVGQPEQTRGLLPAIFGR